jgi:precorrin-2 dehydrogenase/sirohydrochlorin ferrochelatase
MKPLIGSTYPVSLDLREAHVLLVGGGEVAFRKARGLARSGCRLTVVARDFSPPFLAWLQEHRVKMERRAYLSGEAAAYFLVISATDDAEVNQTVFEDACRAGRLINVVDQPELCNLYIPSRMQRGNLQVAISTGGKCPAFARWLRRDLEEVVPERYGLLLDRLAHIRSTMKETVPSQGARKRILERLLRSEAVRRFLAGDDHLLNRMERGWQRASPRLGQKARKRT